MDTPIEECMKRDTKGLYKKALAGEIKQFTGVDDPYETPENPEVVLKTCGATPEESAKQLLAYIEKEGLIPKA
jgi:bifunctional enzyme CysN/CysC